MKVISSISIIIILAFSNYILADVKILPTNDFSKEVFIQDNNIWYKRSTPFPVRCVCSYKQSVYISGAHGSKTYFANSTNQGRTWSIHKIADQDIEPNDCLVLDNGVIYLATYGIMASLDNGKTWKYQDKNSQANYASLTLTKNNIYAFGGTFNTNTGERSMLVSKTIINGAQWSDVCWPFANGERTKQFGISAYRKNSVYSYFIAFDNTGSYYYLSTNEGENWYQRSINSGCAPSALTFFGTYGDYQNILVATKCNDDPPFIFLSTDGGFTFTWQENSKVPSELIPMKFIGDGDVIYSSMMSSKDYSVSVYATSDMGKSWYKVIVK